MIKHFLALVARFPRVTPVISAFVLVLFGVALFNLPVKTQVQYPQEIAIVGDRLSGSHTGDSATEVFLELAETVGQSVPAKRLVKLMSDPNPPYIAVVDFNQPSTVKRLHLFDIKQKKVESYYVAHGRGSEGNPNDAFAEVFSNQHSSNSSSLGVYRAMDEYVGKHGRSMRLKGLEPSNSNALERAIVLHKADYVSETFIRTTGRLGRSQGCFAVEPSVGDMLVDKLKNGGYIIAWKA